MKGFTVLEALVVAVVAMILYLAAWPSFAALLAEHRRVVTVNALVASLQHARHAAVMRNRVVSVCPSSTSARCDGDWRVGWVAFMEPADWRPGHAIPADAVLHRGDPATGVSVRSNRKRFRFRPHGRSSNGTALVCSERTARAVIVAASGRVRSAQVDVARCRK